MKTDSALFCPGRRVLCRLLPVYAAVLLLAGCRQTLDVPPVIVSKPVCLLSSVYDSFSYAGVSFECHNTADRQLVSLSVSFHVFSDASGGNPFYGSNAVTADVSAVIPAGGTATFEISLDDRLAFIPSEPFFIDCFYVSRATFADGSSWSDPAGLYYAGSLP